MLLRHFLDLIVDTFMILPNIGQGSPVIMAFCYTTYIIILAKFSTVLTRLNALQCVVVFCRFYYIQFVLSSIASIVSILICYSMAIYAI